MSTIWFLGASSTMRSVLVELLLIKIYVLDIFVLCIDMDKVARNIYDIGYLEWLRKI